MKFSNNPRMREIYVFGCIVDIYNFVKNYAHCFSTHPGESNVYEVYYADQIVTINNVTAYTI